LINTKVLKCFENYIENPIEAALKHSSTKFKIYPKSFLITKNSVRARKERKH